MLKQLFSALRITRDNFAQSKLRTALTILGIVIGVASVTIVMSVGESAQRLILDQIRGVGSNLIAVLPGASEETGPPASVFGVVETSFTNDDLDAIVSGTRVKHVIAGSGYVTGAGTITYRSESLSATYQGVSADFPYVEDAIIAKGRFFTRKEDEQRSRVAVLGSERAQDLFGSIDPIGKVIDVGNAKFTVIGVLEHRGSVAFSSPDQFIYVPVQTAQKRLLGITHLNFARFKVDEEKNLPRVKEDIQKLLRDRHDLSTDEEDDFSVRAITTALELLTTVTNTITFFLVGVASVALLVGGIGVMNIMMIVLSSRVREVGLRKAVGARPRDIMTQFLAESVFITFIGGIIGFVLGVLLTYGIALIAQAMGFEWQFVVTLQAGLIAFGVTIFIGIIFGMYPARKAAKISPMEALRYE